MKRFHNFKWYGILKYTSHHRNIQEGNPVYLREDVYGGNKSEDIFLCVSNDEMKLYIKQ